MKLEGGGVVRVSLTFEVTGLGVEVGARFRADLCLRAEFSQLSPVSESQLHPDTVQNTTTQCLFHSFILLTNRGVCIARLLIEINTEDDKP